MNSAVTTRDSTPAVSILATAQVLLLLALTLPFVWPADPGPSAKLVSMLISAALWSLALGACAAAGWLPRLGAGAWGFILLALVIAAQTLSGQLAYPTEGAVAIMVLLGAALVFGLGLRLARQPAWTRLAAAALLAQGLAQVAIGLAQFGMWQLPALGQWLNVHAPWIYQVISYPGDGRIYGNLRQPNHYATAVAMGFAGLAGLAPRLRASQVWSCALLLAWALVASGSRTAMVHVVVIAALVLAAVPRSWRDPKWQPLLAAPLLFALWWGALHVAARLGLISYLDAVTRQLNQPVDARSIIWHNAWQAYQLHPLAGWGWGQIGWALERSAVAGRLNPLPLDNIDNAHDLVLQLLADTGLAGTLPVLLALLAWGWRIAQPWRVGTVGAARRIALLPPLLAASFLLLHSLLEYPLWYIYFLFAFAFGLGWSEGAARPPQAEAPLPEPGSWRRRAGIAAGCIALALTLKAGFDYAVTADIYDGDDDAGQRSTALDTNWFFVPLAEFADAAAVLPAPGADQATLQLELAQLERSSHAWGDPGLLSRRMVVLLRLGQQAQAFALADYTAHAFWLYAQQTADSFGGLAAQAGLQGDADVARIQDILRHAPVLRRVVVPRH
jgi:O-antigen ligase